MILTIFIIISATGTIIGYIVSGRKDDGMIHYEHPFDKR